MQRGLLPSRSRARDAVLRGIVKVNGFTASKPSKSVLETDQLQLSDESAKYVSRAALKLLHGLDHFGVNVKDMHCLDLGASTGGFTQVLLERGAAHVTAIDVGHGQMTSLLLADRRVTSHEGINARDLSRDYVSETISIVVCDVSFISLKLVLPNTLSLVNAGCNLVALTKPQFEAGREHVGKGGLVTDAAQHQRVCEEIAAFLQMSGWHVAGFIPSPIEGGDGNREFLVHAIKA